MMKQYLASLPAALLLLCPLFSHAETVRAGLPQEPLWLSSRDIVEGQSVGIFTVLYNESTLTVTGSASFSVDGAVVNTLPFEIKPGGNVVATTKWQAIAGSHTITVRLASDGPADLSGTEASLTVAVASPPAPTKAQAAAEFATALVASSTPVIQASAQKAFAFTESLREDAAAYLESKLADAEDGNGAADTAHGAVLGTSTQRASAAGSWFSSLSQAVYRLALSVARSAWLFYPVFAFFFFIVLYLLIKSVRRPRSQLR